MNTSATRPLFPMLAVCIGLSSIAVAAPARAADASTRTLDWNRAAPAAVQPPTTTPTFGGAPAPQAFGTQASAPSRSARPATSRAGTAPAAKGLFSLDDRAIIIVGGKSTTAGDVKRSLAAELAATAGPPKTVAGGRRKLDPALLVVAGDRPGDAGAGRGPKPAPTGTGGVPQPGPRTSAGTSNLDAAQIVRPGVTATVAAAKAGAGIASVRCADKALPKISEVTGKLKAGDRVSVWGECFGELAGRVEIIGQFPGGKLKPAFTSWSHSAIEIEVPATVRGAADHVVAVTVVTADGRISPAMPGQFVAARERVEVPDRLWSPAPDYELSATAESGRLIDPNEVNQAYAGQTSKTLRVQPQCALDSMDVVVHSGSVSQVRGWEAGPPHEAAVSIDWRGTCTSTRTTTNYNYVVVEGNSQVSVHSACRVAFHARAWAYCPLGVAP